MRAISFALASTLAGLLALAQGSVVGETDCGGRCVSLLNDANNCGSCGRAATSLQVCRAGALTCAPGTGLCGDTCTDLARDPLHCGSCATACER